MRVIDFSNYTDFSPKNQVLRPPVDTRFYLRLNRTQHLIRGEFLSAHYYSPPGLLFLKGGVGIRFLLEIFLSGISLLVL